MSSNGHHDTDNGIEVFVEEAQQAGYIHLDDILEQLSEQMKNGSELEHVLRRLDEVGVEVYGNGDGMTSETNNLGRLSYIPSDDAVTLYFREVGTIPLLTREQEAELAKLIERGEAAKNRLNEELSEAERAALEEAIRAGDAARHKLIIANTRLVISLAKNYLGQGVPLLDLIQEGNIGLMHAVRKFDWRRGHKFSTYATWWIRQALTRAVADQGRTIRLPIHRQEQVRKLHQATRELTKVLGREPTPEELGTVLDKSADDVEQLMQDAERPISLEKPVAGYVDSQLSEFLESNEPLPFDVAEDEALEQDIRDLLNALPFREARIIELRYGLRDGREYTLKEVGDLFGVTRERIRQIEQDALHRLRSPARTRKVQAYLT